MIKHLKINYQIKAQEVKLINEEGEFKGIHPIQQALNMAMASGLDLVEVSPGTCKILDYGKFIYEQKKKQTKQKLQDTLEIRLSPNINNHDVEYKIKHAKRILSRGDKIKLIIVFKGRQMQHTDLGIGLLKTVTERLIDTAILADNPKLEGKYLSVTVAPKK
ncbi:translation initiation factor IF-3 [Candidatus Daviesbacteria bacterium]|nr:translation initiation factor IF-3 [Candidatus Daviesbacteria bacterium]